MPCRLHGGEKSDKFKPGRWAARRHSLPRRERVAGAGRARWKTFYGWALLLCVGWSPFGCGGGRLVLSYRMLFVCSVLLPLDRNGRSEKYKEKQKRESKRMKSSGTSKDGIILPPVLTGTATMTVSCLSSCRPPIFRTGLLLPLEPLVHHRSLPLWLMQHLVPSQNAHRSLVTIVLVLWKEASLLSISGCARA